MPLLVDLDSPGSCSLAAEAFARLVAEVVASLEHRPDCPSFAVSCPLFCYCHIIAMETCFIAAIESVDFGQVGSYSA